MESKKNMSTFTTILLLIFGVGLLALPMIFLLLINKNKKEDIFDEQGNKISSIESSFQNKTPLTLGEKLIFKTFAYWLYLVIMTCIGLIQVNTINNLSEVYLFSILWYQIIIFTIPSIIFWLWFITEYIYIIYIKCKQGWKELDNSTKINNSFEKTISNDQSNNKETNINK